MVLPLLFACRSSFPCGPGQLLREDGACLPAPVEQGTTGPCDTGAEPRTDTGEPIPDADGDGSAAGEDCDDGDPDVFPGAVEARDGRDQDCDELVDEDVPDLLFDLDATRQAVEGLGANIWPDSAAWVGPMEVLQGRWVRVGLGPIWDTVGAAVPVGGSRADYDEYVAAAMASAGFGSLDDALRTWAELERLGLGLILLNWESPGELEVAGALSSAHITDYARLLGALVGHLADHGIAAPWLELTNEPDGSWNTFVYPSDYAALVVAVRAELDARGLVDTRIAGPGLSTLAQGGASARYLQALTPEAVAALGGWSAHGYDDGVAEGDGLAVFRDAVVEFTGRARELDPELPVLITELASLDPYNHGVEIGSPLGCGEGSSTEEYGVRMLAYTLLALRAGASTVLPWQAADPDWGGCWGSFGMVDAEGTARPFLHTLAMLAAALPEEARVVAHWEDDPVMAVAGFAAADRFVLALANPTAAPRRRTIGWSGAETLVLTGRESRGAASFVQAWDFSDLRELSFGPGVWQDSANSEYFDGDGARLGGVEGAWIALGEGTPIADFALDAWRWSGIARGSFTVEGSADGLDWVAIPVDETVEAGPWDRVEFKPSAMPSGLGWLRLTWPRLDPDWALELGGATLTLQPGAAQAPELGAIPTPRLITVEVPAESAMVLVLAR